MKKGILDHNEQKKLMTHTLSSHFRCNKMISRLFEHYIVYIQGMEKNK